MRGMKPSRKPAAWAGRKKVGFKGVKRLGTGKSASL
jgi:hypothetical protein